MIQFMIFQSIFALEAFVTFGTCVNLVVVHNFMLLQSDKSWEVFETDIADLRGSRCVLILVVFESVLALELLVALVIKIFS